MIARLLLTSSILIAAPLAAETAPPQPEESIAASTDPALRMTVPVMVNGQGPFDFVIDTGADRTVISAELAERLGLETVGKARLHAMSGAADVRIVKLSTVKLANRTTRNVRAAALSARHLGADGLLGIDSLKNQRIVMDFDARTMKVEPSAAPEAPAPPATDLIIVTARTRQGQLVMVDADANGEKIWVVVDTGAQNSVGNMRLRRLIARRAPGTAIKPIGMLDVLGKLTTAEYTIVDKVRIGGVRMGNTALAFVDAHPFKLFDLAKKPSMLMGMETLRAFRRVSVDFNSRKIKFLLNEPGTSLAGSQ